MGMISTDICNYNENDNDKKGGRANRVQDTCPWCPMTMTMKSTVIMTMVMISRVIGTLKFENDNGNDKYCDRNNENDNGNDI